MCIVPLSPVLSHPPPAPGHALLSSHTWSLLFHKHNRLALLGDLTGVLVLSSVLFLHIPIELTPSLSSNFAQNAPLSVKSIGTTRFQVAMCPLQISTAPFSLLHHFLIACVHCLLSVYPVLDDKLHEGKDFLFRNSKDASSKQCPKYRGLEYSMCSVSRPWMRNELVYI